MAKKMSHQILMEKNNLKAADMSPKIQSLLTKFANATDEEDKETYNDKLFDLIDDHIEAEKAKKKDDDGQTTPAGKKKDDVSGAPTAKKKEAETPPPAATPKKEESSFLARRFGR